MPSSLSVLLILLAVAVGYAVWRRRTTRGTADTGRRDPFADVFVSDGDVHRLAPGAVITFDADDWVVRGSMRLDDGGDRWAEHMIDNGRRQRWLSVYGDDVAMWDKVAVGDVVGTPGDATVVWDAVTWTLEERGTATFTAEGTTNSAASGQLEYVEYRNAADDRRLALERQGTWEASVGYPTDVRSLHVYPAGTDS